LDREKNQQTQFKIGFAPQNYKISSKEYDCSEGGNNRILKKGMAKDTSHNFSMGHAQTIYSSFNSESYKKIDLSKIKRGKLMGNAHQSIIGEQQKKRLEVLKTN